MMGWFRILLLFPLLPVAVAATFSPEGLAKIDDVIAQAITDAETPGAVFRMERDGAVYQKVYGERAILPQRERMTEDTVFDAASLTKVVATTTAVMKLGRAKISRRGMGRLVFFCAGGTWTKLSRMAVMMGSNGKYR